MRGLASDEIDANVRRGWHFSRLNFAGNCKLRQVLGMAVTLFNTGRDSKFPSNEVEVYR
jgi:hypothetical protein